MISLFRKRETEIQFPPPSEHVEGNSQPLGSFSISKKKAKMTDYISGHNKHTTFEYVSISPPDGRTKKSILETLMARKGRVSKDPIRLGELPVFDLREREYTVRLSEVVSKRDMNSFNNWISIYEIYIFFNPSQGFYDEFSAVNFSIVDYRKINDQTVRLARAPNNTSSSIYLSLDYATHKADLHHIALKINCPASILRDGVYWGSARIEMSLLHSTEAVQSALIPVSGVLDMQTSALAKHKRNPTTLDLTLGEEDLSNLIKMRKRNQLMDKTRPKSRQEVEGYAGSEAGSVESYGQDEEDEQETEMLSGGVKENKRQKALENWRSSVEMNREIFNVNTKPFSVGSGSQENGSENNTGEVEITSPRRGPTVIVEEDEEVARAEGKDMSVIPFGGPLKSAMKRPLVMTPAAGVRFT